MVYEKMTKAELIRQLKTLQARSGSTSTADESQHILQELQIHQAELEAQNRELRESRQQLEDSRDRYTDLYDFAPVCYASLDEKAVIQDINLTGAALLGIERSRLLGQPFIHYLAKGDLQTFLSHLKQCRQTRETLTTEVRLVVKDTGSIVGQLLCVAVEDEESQTIAYRIAITDITERKRAEASLRESEARFRRLLETLPVGAYTCDAEGLITYFNPRAVEAWGRTPKLNDAVERFCGSFRLYSSDGMPIPHDQCWMALAIKEDKVYEGREIVIERPDGSRLTVLAHVNPIYDAEGKLLGAVNIVVDITERKRAEAVMAQMAAIVESTDAAILSKDLNGNILSWNPGAEKLFGYRAEEVIGKPVTILIPPDRVDEEPQILERIRRGEQIDHYETVRHRKDGSKIDISLTVSPVRDNSGKVIGASKIARDITESKQAEAALRESEERFRMIADSAPVLIWVNNPTGCEFVNYEYLEFLGVGEGEVLGYGWAQFIHPEDREDCVNAYLEAVSRRGRFEADFRFRRRDGDYRWMRSVGIPRYEGCEFKGYVGISSDIHERKRAEDAIRAAYEQESVARASAEAANRSKDEFLAVVSHELRSPLNAILGYNSLLRENPRDAAQLKRACDIIERNARTQLKLIEDLLDTARIVSGKLRLELRPLDIYPVLADALDMVRPAAEAKGIQLRIEDYAAREDPIIVLGDAARLQQIVWNLLSNAIKFTPAGGRVELRAERTQERIRIMVSDTGEGIQPEFLPHVFDRFRQSDSSSAKRDGGLGLGLALVKHLAEMHGGKVEAASAGPGRGATFTVTLPLATQRELVAAEPLALAASADLVAGAASEAQTEDEIQFPAGVTIAGVRVLVVDDQEEVRVSLADFLNRRGAVVTTVSSSAEALAVLSYPPGGAKPDILVCDIMMPEEDGYAMLRRVRALEAKRGVGKSQQIPAIALTALTGDEDRLQALIAGFQSHIAKPADPDELMLVIANIAGLWRQGAAFNKLGQ